MSRYPGFEYDKAQQRGYFDCRVPGSAGKARRRRTVHAASREEALALWRAFVEELTQEADGAASAPRAIRQIDAASAPAVHEHPSSPAPTLREFVERYYKPIIREAFKPRTQVSHDCIIEQRLVPVFGETPLDQVDHVKVGDFQVALRNTMYKRSRAAEPRPYSPSYVNDCVRVLKMLLHQAVRREVIAVYPIKEKIKKEVEPIVRQEMSDEERYAFLATFDDRERFLAHLAAKQKKGKIARSARYGGKLRRFGGGMRGDSPAAERYFARFRWMQPLFVVALETGLRKGDLLALTWGSINLRAGWIRVVMEKTEFEATIPISVACEAALAECRRRAPNAERVFVDEHGRAIPEMRMRRTFVLAKKLANIKRPCRIHDLRHTFASRLVSDGIGLSVVAKALGHTTTEQTERYAKPSDAAMRGIKTVLDRDAERRFLSTHSAA